MLTCCHLCWGRKVLILMKRCMKHGPCLPMLVRLHSMPDAFTGDRMLQATPYNIRLNHAIGRQTRSQFPWLSTSATTCSGSITAKRLHPAATARAGHLQRRWPRTQVRMLAAWSMLPKKRAVAEVAFRLLADAHFGMGLDEIGLEHSEENRHALLPSVQAKSSVFCLMCSTLCLT